MKKKTIPKISETEWEVMRVVWARHPATASEIIGRLTASDSSWHPKTVRTLLARLVRKQALGYQSHGRRYVYEPLVSEQECVTAVSASFLERVFGGALKPMLVHFMESRRLTKQDLAELRQVLDQDGRKDSR